MKKVLLVFFCLGWITASHAEIGEIDVNVPTQEKAAPAAPEDHSTMWIRSGSRIYVVVKDTKGRKVGVDPKTRKTLVEIPNSHCAADFVQNAYTGENDGLDETITFEPAAEGRYTFLLTGMQPGPYLISHSALGRGGSSLPSKEVEGLISEGEQKMFTLNFQPEATNAFSVIEEHQKK
jgi:hypothetical protein